MEVLMKEKKTGPYEGVVASFLLVVGICANMIQSMNVARNVLKKRTENVLLHGLNSNDHPPNRG